MTREEFISQLVKCREDVVAYGIATFPNDFSEDCVSDAIVIALEKFKNYNETCQVKTFVTRIYKNLQLQEYYKKRRKLSEIPQNNTCYQWHAFDYNYIISKINLLTPCQREAIERIMSGKKTREIAEEINKTPLYVATYKCIVRNKLRKLINDESLLENYQPNAALAHNKRHTYPDA